MIHESPTLEAVWGAVESCSPELRALRLRRFVLEHGAHVSIRGAALIVDGTPIDCRRDAAECVEAVGELLGY